jgi:ABC-type Fe3+-citrate transport system substrate-binding protein
MSRVSMAIILFTLFSTFMVIGCGISTNNKLKKQSLIEKGAEEKSLNGSFYWLS